MGFSTDLYVSPVLGCVRLGEARLFTIISTGPIWRTSAIVFSRASSENASAFRLRANNPAAWASFSKATELYQPAVAGRLSAGGRSKNTPTVAAPAPNAALMREPSPVSYTHLRAHETP